MFNKIPGTRDILPEEVTAWQEIEDTARRIFATYNYQQIRTPIMEEAALFNRSLGETAEIIQKQMFLIERGQDVYALRPEGTAPIARSYLENNLDKSDGFLKLFYIGPMFRCERPQKGRLRQFHHIGCEVIGSADAGVDVEVLSLADALLKSFSVDGYKIKINSLGCRQDKATFSEQLRKALKAKLADLCEDCQRRFKTNALRILDCKKDSCIELVSKLELGREFLCPECEAHFQEVKSGLESLKINYEFAPRLVRGLDYYTRTVFEVVHSGLGAQDALGAGGRYDNLVRELGGKDAGAIGFAFGIERLLLVMPQTPCAGRKNLVYIVSLGEEAKKIVLGLLDALRKSGIPSDTDYEDKSLKGAMRRADDLGARFVLIIGDDELKKGVVTLKDMESGQQKEIRQEGLAEELKKGSA